MAANRQNDRAPRDTLDLRSLSDALGSVTRAGRVLGFGWKRSPTQAPVPAKSPPRHHLPARLEATVVQLSLDHRSWGAVRLSNEMQRRGYQVTPWDVRQVWDLHDLLKQEQRTRASERSQATWRAMGQGGVAPRKTPANILSDLVIWATLCGVSLVAAVRILAMLR